MKLSRWRLDENLFAAVTWVPHMSDKTTKGISSVKFLAHEVGILVRMYPSLITPHEHFR